MKTIHNEAHKKIDLYSDDGAHLGEIEYKYGGNNTYYATHTEVYPEYEGKGYAKQLLNALVEFAVDKRAKIVPICPYVVSQFRNNPDEYAAVIDK